MRTLRANELITEILMLKGDQPLFIVMTGLPGSGKTTIVKQLRDAFTDQLGTDFVVASTDDLIEKHAAEIGKTYSETMHSTSFKFWKQELNRTLDEAFKAGRDIISDQTNVSVKARRKKLAHVDSHYVKISVNVVCDEAVRKLRNQGRYASGKIVPEDVVSDMSKSFITPQKTEGFAHAFTVNTN